MKSLNRYVVLPPVGQTALACASAIADRIRAEHPGRIVCIATPGPEDKRHVAEDYSGPCTIDVGEVDNDVQIIGLFRNEASAEFIRQHFGKTQPP